jgi:hypothetical protein
MWKTCLKLTMKGPVAEIHNKKQKMGIQKISRISRIPLLIISKAFLSCPHNCYEQGPRNYEDGQLQKNEGFDGAPGKTRTCDLLIHNQKPSRIEFLSLFPCFENQEEARPLP